ncbi:MAG: DEAD/DEAH box helicase [Synechococcaceae cyanobacterium]
MDVFSFRDRVVEDYGQFSRSFTQIKAPDLRDFVDGRYGAGEYWPSPLIQLNPSFVGGGSISALVEEGLLHPECSRIFRWGKAASSQGSGDGVELLLHRHQREAIQIARAGGSLVVISGTGSGKSLGYMIPIINRVLEERERGDQGKRIRAIVIYPMNALCNSQIEELQKYLGWGYPDGPRVTFARYTGQESEEEREQIKNDPPDILLTNYVMLEYILTRQDPLDQKVISDAQGLEFLVLDELHTYRGRQGADVALLVRRVRQRLNADLICIGTSATMASEGTAAERNGTVAQVASKLFGTDIPVENIVTETLERLTLGDLPSAAELSAALDADASAAAPAAWTADDLRQHPLARWVELRLGLEREDGRADGKWVRCRPRSLQHAALELAKASGRLAADADPDAEEARQARDAVLTSLRKFLLAAYRIEVGPNRRFFAFRLHQFVSAGGEVHASLDAPGRRYLTLKGQKYQPNSGRQALLYPVVFCRSCGQEFHPVWTRLHNRRPERFEPRSFSDAASLRETDVVNGYLMPDADAAYELEDLEQARFPDGWLETNRDGELVLKRTYREFAPVPCRVRSDGTAGHDGTPAWFLKGSFRFCPSCGVEHNVRGSEFKKLCGLNSEGRSSATTTVSLAVLRQLLSFPEDDIPDNARKLLAFSDNRQDASLQAGHFNDFVRVLQLRAGLVAALRARPDRELSLEALALDTEKALRLTADDFIATKGVKPNVEQERRRALRGVLEYRLLVDLRKGWRLTNPNLEQLRLLEIDYAQLVNCAEDQADWQQRHPLLAQASHEERFLILHRLLEELRERLAIDCDALGLEEFERRRKACFDLEEVWAIRADEQPELARTVLMSPVTDEQRKQRLEGLSLRGAFGRWLKARERWLSVEELHRGLKWKDDLYQEITGHLLAMLKSWGLVKPVEVRVGRRRSEVLQGWRLNSSALRWTLVDAPAVASPPTAPQDSYAERLQQQRQNSGRRGPVNSYFRSLYEDLASLIADPSQAEGRPFVQTLEAREHTAQVEAGVREQREKQFREARLRLLYCSPTMELGVDISSLNTVYLRNVPPTPANYAQRSGRAGRSGQPALVLSYCGATSPHDQYFFADPTRMVAGAVSAPTLELANEELLKAHFRALWLAATRQRLPNKVKDLVDLASEGRPLLADLREALASDDACRSAQADGQAIVDDLLEHHWLGSTPPPWLTGSWLDALIRGAALDFDAALRRWRELLEAVDSQFAQAQKDLANHALSERERQAADQRQRAARLQQQLLLADKPGSSNNNNDFSTYRYLASQGFMPGYNFPRLPLMAYIPGTREQVGGGTFITRPRFVGISEFGPHSLIYHEGNTYKVRGAILGLQDNALVSGTATLATQDALLCGRCGHAHVGTARDELELCRHCGAALKEEPEGKAVRVPRLYQIEQVNTRRAERITSDDEERQRLGYELLTTYEFPQENGVVKVARAQVSSGGLPLLELSYAPATQISRINLGWRRRENRSAMGFPIHPISGRWGGEKQLAAGASGDGTGAKGDGEDDSASDNAEVGYVKITPFVQDRKNALLLQLAPPPAANSWEPLQLLSLKNALKRGIEVAFQLDGSEIAAELMPNEEEASALLLYESAEGGAGVLSRLVESPSALRQLGRTALEVCHWKLSDPLPATEAALEDADPECEAGCYRCLLGYHNQREHDRIDRRLPALKQFLLDLARGELVGQGGSDSRSERLERLRVLCQSGLERLWLDTAFRLGHHLPDDAQKEVSGHYVTPDFTYREAAALVFIDGPHHHKPLQQRLDQQKRQALKDAGIRVVVFDQHSEEWPELFREHAWLFGEGKGGGSIGSRGSSSPPPQQRLPEGPGPDQGPTATDLGEALDAVFAQHQQLFGKETQP